MHELQPAITEMTKVAVHATGHPSATITDFWPYGMGWDDGKCHVVGGCTDPMQQDALNSAYSETDMDALALLLSKNPEVAVWNSERRAIRPSSWDSLGVFDQHAQELATAHLPLTWSKG